MSQPLLPLVLSFNAGEFSPYLRDRIDLNKYDSGCEILENFHILPYGAADFRPGLLYVGEVKDSTKATRLLPFTFSTTTSFFLELGDLYMRFWNNDGTRIESGGSPVEITTPWAEADIFTVTMTQLNDVAYLTAPGYPPQKLTRNSATSWTIEAFEPVWPPLLDENVETTTLTASATTGSGITITASADTFTADHVGSFWQISHYTDANYIEDAFDANGTSGTIAVIGEWQVNTYGTWEADLILEISTDAGTTWETVRSFHSGASGAGARNITFGRTEKVHSLLRMRIANRVSGTATDKAILEVFDAKHSGLVEITAYASATSVTATVIRDLAATTATDLWAEGAWSEKRGYPRCSTYHQGRLYFAGSEHQPNRVWGSIVDDFENFALSADDDAGLSFQLASTKSNTVQWLVSQNKLLIGTSGDEWRVAGSSDTALTPTNLDARPQTGIGSALIQIGLANEAVLFAERLGKNLREFVYSFEVDGYVADDLSLLSSHITEPGIKQVAYQQQYDSRLWLVMDDGSAATMTYERRQEVAGWGRLVTDGTFESVASTYGNTSGEDEVWMIINRTINGATKRYIERIDPDARDKQAAEDKTEMCYLDCSKIIDLGSSGTSVTGLDHLEGKEVHLLVDGAIQPSKTVTSGAITLDKAGQYVSVGLKYVGYLKPMPITFQIGDGTSRGRRTRIHEIVASLYLSSDGLEAAESRDSTKWEPAFFRDTADTTGDPTPLYTGDKRINPDVSFHDRGDIVLRQNKPLPATILSLVPKSTVHGN